MSTRLRTESDAVGTSGVARDVAVREVLDLIASKWTMLVVDALAAGPRRYGALRRAVAGVSQKVLTQTLRALERDGIVERTVYHTKPPAVDYRLTALGVCLSNPIGAVRRWADSHFELVVQAREARRPASDVSRLGVARATAPPSR